MELGYFTMPLHPPGSNLTKTLDDDLGQIVLLDKLGYKEAWIGEHFTAEWENIPCPDLFIAKALGMTTNIVLGTGVTCMPNHSPFMLAHRIAQLDHMAHGRFYWGVGSGGFPGDLQVVGMDPETGEHRTMTRDAIDVILKIWEDPKPGNYSHKYWNFNIPEPIESYGLRMHVTPYQKPHPPIMVAGVTRKSGTLAIAGERGWIPMSINIVPTPVLTTHWESVEEGAQKSGRTPNRSEWRIAREIYVAETTEQARKDTLNGVLKRDHDEYFYSVLERTGMIDLLKVDPEMPDREVTAEYVMDNIWIVGSPEEVANKIRKMYQDVGGFGTVLAMGHEWEPKEQWENSMALLAEEVMPKLSDLSI